MTEQDQQTDHDSSPGVSWKYARGLESRIRALESWRATSEAVAASWRTALPWVLSITSLAVTIINVFFVRHHH